MGLGSLSIVLLFNFGCGLLFLIMNHDVLFCMEYLIIKLPAFLFYVNVLALSIRKLQSVTYCHCLFVTQLTCTLFIWFFSVCYLTSVVVVVILESHFHRKSSFVHLWLTSRFNVVITHITGEWRKGAKHEQTSRYFSSKG